MTFSEPPSKEILVLIIALILSSAVSFTMTIVVAVAMLTGLILSEIIEKMLVRRKT